MPDHQPAQVARIKGQVRREDSLGPAWEIDGPPLRRRRPVLTGVLSLIFLAVLLATLWVAGYGLHPLMP